MFISSKVEEFFSAERRNTKKCIFMFLKKVATVNIVIIELYQQGNTYQISTIKSNSVVKS